VLELQRRRFAEASRLAEELRAIGERLGDGSEAPYARALMALCAFAEDPTQHAAFAAALAALRAADAKQRLAHALLCAADVDLLRDQATAARDWATEALELATLLERPSDIALARVALARAATLAGDTDAVRRQRTHLADPAVPGLSAQARAAIAALDAAGAPRRRTRR
jgi:hypothetical protein